MFLSYFNVFLFYQYLAFIVRKLTSSTPISRGRNFAEMNIVGSTPLLKNSLHSNSMSIPTRSLSLALKRPIIEKQLINL